MDVHRIQEGRFLFEWNRTARTIQGIWRGYVLSLSYKRKLIGILLQSFTCPRARRVADVAVVKLPPQPAASSATLTLLLIWGWDMGQGALRQKATKPRKRGRNAVVERAARTIQAWGSRGFVM
jgi:hypothetical protein